ncbi:MAG: LysR family transcriptional regulator [Steroidobacteraceae bacterium]
MRHAEASIEMQQLRHFCAAVDHGQIAAAARAIAITQPALSRSIRNLETRVGYPLLERTAKGVALTAYGEIFLEHARSVLNEVQRAHDNLAALSGLARGRVNFGLNANFDTFLVPDALGALLRASPGVSVQATSAFYDELVVKVRTSELDFAVVLLPEVHGHPDLVEEEIVPVTFHVYAPATHPLAGRRNLTLADIATRQWVLPEHPAMRVFERYFHAAGVTPPKAVMLANSVPLVVSSIVRCGLLSLLADHLLDAEVKAGRVVALDVPALPAQNDAALVYRAGAVISPAARALMNEIRRAAREWIDQQAIRVPRPARSPARGTRTGRKVSHG